jgi:hypothetical protein
MAHLSGASLLAALMLLAPYAALGAQASTPLSPGMRVQVKVATIPSARGRVVSVNETSFGFQPDGSPDTLTVDFARVERLDMSGGLQHRILHFAALGGAGGLVVGGIIGAAEHPNFPDTEEPSGQSGCSVTDPECTGSGEMTGDPTGVDAKRTATRALLGAAIGGVAGAIFGSLRKWEVWKRIPSDQYHVHVAVQPMLNGVGMRLSLTM